ncbi:MBL-fold metallo-hydrolase superfamily [hydrothermal vent metagenome]|uniref:MBL-fold metallo-hydrolase superfamily n=1 Tax=hydrothermal vent metagenome TaxID=652676 RepID=A0A3B0RZZ2_9ZZZZ
MPTTVSRRRLLTGAAGLIAAPYVLRGFSSDAQAKAPMLGPERPNHYRFKFGKMEITTINDGAFYLAGPFPIFGADQFPEDVEELAIANKLSPKRMEIGFTPVIINTGNELVLFDTGNGDSRGDSVGYLQKAMKIAGYTPEQVDVVVISHFHFDHIGGLMAGGKLAFPNARYVIGEAENNFWLHPDQAGGSTGSTHTLSLKNVKPLAEKTTFIKDGASVATGITAISAAGHTPGHMAYHIESDGNRIFLGGDFCNHYVMSLQNPEWHVSFDMEKQQAGQARRKLLDMLATEKIPFTSYHMPFPAVGYVDRKDDGFVYVPATYQLNL